MNSYDAEMGHNCDLKKMDDSALLKLMDEAEANWEAAYREANEFGERMRSFLYDPGSQWDEEAREDQELRFKATYENNAVRSIQMQIEAEMRESAPQAVLIPASDNVPYEVLQTKEGLYKEICYQSNTSDVYTQTFVNQGDIGYGAFRITAEQENPHSFNSVIRYKRIQNAMDTFFDPSAPDACKQEGDVSGLKQDVSLAKLQRQYPKHDFSGEEGSVHGNAKNIRIANVYMKNYKPVTLIMLSNKKTTTLAHYNRFKKELAGFNAWKTEEHAREQKELKKLGLIDKVTPYVPVQAPTITKRLKGVDWTIMHFVRTKHYILEKREIKVKRLPMVFVPGNIKIVGGREKPLPFAIDAMTPQQLLNYVISNIIDNVDRSLGVRVVAPRVATQQYSDQINRPHNNNLISFDPTPGTPGNGAPVMINAPSFDPNLLALYQQCKSDIAMTLGRSPESSGEQSNTHTFGGILLRQMAGNKAVGVITSNLLMGIAEGAKTVLDWMPYVYDVERTVRIKTADGKNIGKVINEITGFTDAYGELEVKNDMTLGEFSVEAYGGPSFAMQQLAALHVMMQLMNEDPALRPIMYDLFFKELPFSFANELSRRAKDAGLISPKVVADENGEPEPEPQPSPEEELIKKGLEIKDKQLDVQAQKVQADHFKNVASILGDFTQMRSDTARSVADIAEAYAKAPFEDIEEALNQTENMLTQQEQAFDTVVKKAQEAKQQPKMPRLKSLIKDRLN